MVVEIKLGDIGFDCVKPTSTTSAVVEVPVSFLERMRHYIEDAKLAYEDDDDELSIEMADDDMDELRRLIKGNQ